MTMERPTISYMDALEQASITTDRYFFKAIDMIDAQFGEGYAKKNPQLIAPLVQSQVNDFNTCCVTGALWEVAEKIGDLSPNSF